MTDTRKKNPASAGQKNAGSKSSSRRRRRHSGKSGGSNTETQDALDPDRILKLFSNRDPQPLTKTQISRQLKLSPDDRSALRKVLRKMEDSGALVKSRGERFVPADTKGLRKGRLIAKEAGFGFVVTDDPDEPDVFIPERKTGVALNGDRVLVQLEDPRFRRRRGGKKGPHHEPKPGERLSGKIVKVLERANVSVVGTLRVVNKTVELMPDDASMPAPILVVADDQLPENLSELEDMKAVVRLLEWEHYQDQLSGHLVEILGDAGDPEVAMQAIIHKYRLPESFPDDVLEQAQKIQEKIPKKELREREDLRDEFIITIDPTTSKDFDDAISVQEHGDGWDIGVHIADVSHYVEPGSPIDKEALNRGNSVYLADRVIPMIPERLSNIICSLQPHVERCARSVFCTIDKKGNITKPRFARTVIKSKHRLTYKQALDLLQNPVKNDDVSAMLQQAWGCASAVRKKRFDEGALDLDFPEIEVVYDKQGRATDLIRSENDISHQLIEEFMLIANETVAKTLREKNVPAIYRIHEDPDPSKLAEYRFLISTFGLEAGDLTQRGEMQKFLASIKDHPEANAIKIGLLKSLNRALYDTQPVGHYGLAKANYCHFTSPIRRYADLVVHRSLLKLIDAGSDKKHAKLPTQARMKEIAEHISETERVATDAERESLKLKQLEFLQSLLDQHQGKGTPTFEGLVTDVRKFGLFIELPKYLLVGFLSLEDMEDDHYIMDNALGGFVGRSTRCLVKVGSTLDLVIKEIDMTKKQVDFAPAKPVSKQLGTSKEAQKSQGKNGKSSNKGDGNSNGKSRSNRRGKGSSRGGGGGRGRR